MLYDERMGQLTLPDIPEPPFNPKHPTARLQRAALSSMLAGEAIDQPKFLAATGSWRLAAVVYCLTALGWPVLRRSIPCPHPDDPAREVSSYYLARDTIQLARLSGGEP